MEYLFELLESDSVGQDPYVIDILPPSPLFPVSPQISTPHQNSLIATLLDQKHILLVDVLIVGLEANVKSAQPALVPGLDNSLVPPLEIILLVAYNADLYLTVESDLVHPLLYAVILVETPFSPERLRQ